MKADGMPGIHSMRTCEVCGTEMPLDEAIIPEASDYLIYLCGLECFARWRLGLRTRYPQSLIE